MLGGQGVTFAPSKTKPATRSSRRTTVTFGADPRSGDGPRFQPKVDEAEVVIPAVKQATGWTWHRDDQVGAELPRRDAGDAIGNAANVFARVTNGALELRQHRALGRARRPGPVDLRAVAVPRPDRRPGQRHGRRQVRSGGDLRQTSSCSAGITLSDIIDILGVTDALIAANKVPKLVTERKTDRVDNDATTWCLSRRTCARRIPAWPRCGVPRPRPPSS